MRVYSTYQEAKIANPSEDIIMYGNMYQSSDTPCKPSEWWKKCNPADYCMTVEKFLADGHKFVDGDAYLDRAGDIEIVGKLLSASVVNEKGPNDNDRYVLRAAALETKEPKRTRESYEKVEFIKLSDAALAVNSGNIQFNKFGNQPIDDKALALHYYNNGSLSFYRRIETPIEWWEDASEFINQTDDDNCSSIMEGKLHVNATLTREEACDFARILLEQGE